MVYYKPAFKLFYKALLKSLRDKEFTDMPEIKLRRPTRALWEICGKNELVPRSLKIAGEHSDSAMIFDDILYRGPYCHSKVDEIVIAGLKYIGIQLPKVLENIALDAHKQSSVLFQLFLEDIGELQHFLEVCPDLFVFDHDTRSIKDDVIKRNKNLSVKKTSSHKLLPVQNLANYASISSIKSSSVVHTLKDSLNHEEYVAIETFIFDFFKNLLSPGRKGWDAYGLFNKELHFKNDINNLIRGYVWTTSIHNIHIFDIKKVQGLSKSGNIIDCKVYFEEDIDIMRAFDTLKPKWSNKENLEAFYKILIHVRSGKDVRECELIDQGDGGIFNEWDKLINMHLNIPRRMFGDFYKPTVSAFKNLYEMRISKRNDSFFITTFKGISNF